MFEFRIEPEVALLTATRTGEWSLDTVASYELALRQQLAILQQSGPSTSFIIDIRSSGAQPRFVADALKMMVARLGPLHARRTAVVTSSGVGKLQARRVADVNARIFTSMKAARNWLLDSEAPALILGNVHDEPSEADAEGRSVHIHGPSNVDVALTPAAALETAKRIGNAAVEALLAPATLAPMIEAKSA